MNRMYRGNLRLLFVTLLFLVSVVCFADSVWNGSATVSRFGELPDEGNYAASSSFQANTRILVTNLENGKSTTVTITSGIADPSLFLLISTDAATELGIEAGDLIQVRATFAQSESLVSTDAEDRAFSRDPDINPAAFVESEAVASISSDDGRETDPVENDNVVIPVVTPVDESSPETETIVETDVEPDAQVDVVETETGDDEGIIEETVVAVESPVVEEPSDENTEIISEALDEPEILEPSAAEPEIGDVAVVTTLEQLTPESEAAIDRSVSIDEPDIIEASTIFVSALLPEPELDETERFVLLTPPDEPEYTIPSIAEPVVERDGPGLLVLDPPTSVDEETVFVITPPEPIFFERIAEVPDEPETLLSVTLIEDSTPAESVETDVAIATTSLDEPVIFEVEPGVIEPRFDDVKFVNPILEDVILDVQVSELPVAQTIDADDVGIVSDRAVASSLRNAIAQDPYEDTLPEELEPDEPMYELAIEDMEIEEPDVARVEAISMVSAPEAIESDDVGETVVVAEPIAPEPVVSVAAILETATGTTVETGPRIEDIRRPIGPDDTEVEIVVERAEPRPPEPKVDTIAVAEATTDVAVVTGEPVEPVIEETIVDEPDTGEVTEVLAATEPEVVASIETGPPALPEIIEALKVEPPDVAVDAESSADVEIVLESAAAKAPEKTESSTSDRKDTEVDAETPAVEIAAVSPAAVTVAEALDAQSYYLQLAVFSQRENAQNLSDNLGKQYPVTVYRPREDDPGLYRVLVGPLNEDESGALLYMFKARGYKDAFVRQVR